MRCPIRRSTSMPESFWLLYSDKTVPLFLLRFRIVSKGSVINASNAFFSIIAAHFLMKSEKLTWKKAAGCLVGFAGIIVMDATCSPRNRADIATPNTGILKPKIATFPTELYFSNGFSFSGEGMVLICAFSYGLSSVTLKMISDREKPVTILQNPLPEHIGDRRLLYRDHSFLQHTAKQESERTRHKEPVSGK